MISLRVIRSTGEAIEFSRDMSLSGTLTLSNSLLKNANSLAATWELIRRSDRKGTTHKTCRTSASLKPQ